MSAAELRPAVRELFSRYPKAGGFAPERIAHGLAMLTYVEERRTRTRSPARSRR